MGAQKGKNVQQTSYVISPLCLTDLHNNPEGRSHYVPFTDGKTEAQRGDTAREWGGQDLSFNVHPFRACPSVGVGVCHSLSGTS